LLRAAQWHSSDSAKDGTKDSKDDKDVQAKVPRASSLLKREESFQTKTVISIAYARAHSSKFIPEEGDDLQPVTRLAALASLSPRRFER
jgi:hypothetical protein